MNPEMENSVNGVTQWLQRTGGAVQDFAVEQVPLYCREVVMWELWGGIALCVAALALVPLVIYSWRVAFRWFEAEEKIAKSKSFYLISNAYMGPMIAGIIGIIVIIILVCFGAPKAIRAAVAPRVVIVEHLRSLSTPNQ